MGGSADQDRLIDASSRNDDAVFASLDVTFSEIDYAGFVPRVSLIAQRTSSNISRFETSSTALSFGIESKF